MHLIMLDSKTIYKATSCCECYKEKKTPIPPTIKNVAYKNNKKILQLNILVENMPIQNKHKWQENKKFN